MVTGSLPSPTVASSWISPFHLILILPPNAGVSGPSIGIFTWMGMVSGKPLDGDGVVTCGEGVLTCGDGVLTCGEGVLTCGDGVLTCGEGVLTCGDGVVTCGEGVLTCGEGVPGCGDGVPGCGEGLAGRGGGGSITARRLARGSVLENWAVAPAPLALMLTAGTPLLAR